MANSGGRFRESMKDILIYKDDLETQFTTALEAAQSRDDLIKLSNVVKKMEKLLEELKIEIDKRGEKFTAGNLNGPPVQPVAVSSHSPPRKPMAQQPYPTEPRRPPLLPTPTVAPQLSGQDARSAQGRPAGHKQMVFSNQARNIDFSRKNLNIPDTHRIFLHSLSPDTTKESLYTFFTELGHYVVDVMVFHNGNTKPPSGAVGFSAITAVKEILQQQLQIDGHSVTARQYRTYTSDACSEAVRDETFVTDVRSDSKQQHSGNTVATGSPFQVFCGGVPVRATVNELKKALGQFGAVREIRLPPAMANNGVAVNRGFAFVDFASPKSAQACLDVGFVVVLGKEVECAPNTDLYLHQDVPPAKSSPKTNSSSLSGSMANLSAALPGVSGSSKSSNVSTSLRKSNSVSSGHGDEKFDKCKFVRCGCRKTCMECGKGLKICPGCGEEVESVVENVVEPSTV